MRYHEIASGLRVPVSSEESDILTRAEKDGLLQADLDERDGEVANKMAMRGLLDRVGKADAVKYKVNSVKDIWREP